MEALINLFILYVNDVLVLIKTNIRMLAVDINLMILYAISACDDTTRQ